ncbi:threonine/serine exporter [Helicobacter jaachi]|uniref:Threonine/serine exporter n=2 Tax=Helicobacter jaachi TaxID=1677920 RepID=A0A4U8TAX2_9HELI|nr:threonine/serine exporter [Helicobacter jaachi]
MANGAYTSRVIKCTQRIGSAYGYDVSMVVWIKSITLTLYQKDNYANRRTQVCQNPPLGANFRIISELSALSWQIYDENISLKEAEVRYKHIMQERNFGFVSSLLFASIANATFCKLFNGDVGAQVCVFMGTFAGFIVRYILGKLHVDIRAMYVIVSFVCSFVAYIGVHFGLTKTPEIAVGFSILYLIPGVQIINSLADVLHEYTLMAISRGVNMGIFLICIAVGAYLTLSITQVTLIHI